MTVLQIVFLITGLITLVTALMVVTSPNIVHSALWLIMTLAGIAILFVLLSAPFLAVVQVAVYIDAIAVLIIIVVMLTRHALNAGARQVTSTWWLAAIIAVLFFTALAFTFTAVPLFNSGAEPAAALSGEALLDDLGRSLVDVEQYIIPFEVASVLLLGALIGSIVVAWPLREPGVKEGE
jgi:NADH-quinone oxidoreductase subunit J